MPVSAISSRCRHWRPRWDRVLEFSSCFGIVILSGARVREANSRAVEGSLVGFTCRHHEQEFSRCCSGAMRTPDLDVSGAGVVGLLRLRMPIHFAHRRAPDDSLNEGQLKTEN
jgi:hypothetical protein